MTDWLPWGASLMAGFFVTQGLTLWTLGKTPVGTKPDLRWAWWSLIVFAILALGIYAMYLLYGERWIWYQ
ncbi:MAG: hypothetical protein LC623_06575 [Halobacteriales archaeon]|nr:hypothetical protein [Halobacteriales archaeon]